MGEPQEYTDAKNNLVLFRKKIFEEQISGRVKALLDANHDTLEKFGGVVDGLSVIPYMFGNVKQKAIALRLSGNDVGEGVVAQSKTTFAIGKGTYPTNPPYNVAQRELPEVDYFVYTPPADMSLIEKTTEAVWSNLFVLQVDKGMFKEVPDVQNVMYDYYKFVPIARCKVEISLTDPKSEFVNWVKLSGEATVLLCSVTKNGTTTILDYDLYVFIDANYHGEDGTMGIVPLAMVVTEAGSAHQEVIFIAGGKRVSSKDDGLFSGFIAEGQLAGFSKTHDTITWDTKVTLYANPTILTIEVNDLSMGNTSPSPSTYDKKATESVEIEAIPNSGYIVSFWDLDGTQYPASDTFTVTCYRNHTVKCYFVSGDILILKPNADGYYNGLYRWGDNANYKCVDEASSDGDATFLYGDWTHLEHDLFTIPEPSLPEGAVIDYVKLYSRWRRYRRILPCTCKQILRTHDTTFYREQNDLPEDFEWHIVEETFTRNPYTGNVWTESEVDDLQIGIACGGAEPILDPADTGLRCTQIWAEVKYHVP